uniref:Uncharacterized protein n=1 Tax=Rhizophora mucronata TaxID=61149 RepID=A0A2P2NCN2_RHIMU
MSPLELCVIYREVSFLAILQLLFSLS